MLNFYSLVIFIMVLVTSGCGSNKCPAEMLKDYNYIAYTKSTLGSRPEIKKALKKCEHIAKTYTNRCEDEGGVPFDAKTFDKNFCEYFKIQLGHSF